MFKHFTAVASVLFIASATTSALADGFAPTSHPYCYNNSAMGGAQCVGSNCSGISPYCRTVPFAATIDYGTASYTEWFSEENADITVATSVDFPGGGYTTYRQLNQGFCRGTALVSGVACSGTKCDNVALECSDLTRGRPIMSQCTWSAWQSEEQGQVTFPTHFYAVGAECRGNYCDDLRFRICPVTDGCRTSPTFTPGNDACFQDICGVDPYCCTSYWDDICVSEVESVCGEWCGIVP